MPTTGTDPRELPPPDHLEQLLAEALAAHEGGGAEGLEQFLARHLESAPRLREALADLHGVDLLHGPQPSQPVQLGEFRIRRQLGQGGMGVVYLAEQTSLGREVALKVVRPELLFFDGARERFRREIDAVARLEHPAIVPILATGTADGIPYYAMPCLRGRSAEAIVRDFGGRAPDELTGADLRSALMPGGASPDDTAGTFTGSWWRAVVRLLRQAAGGIQHAHARGILHRDLKPSNLMLTADGRAIVLDFGLAQARGDAKLTRTGSAAGSPAYMAPEQVRGGVADERTDVYGLGATLHCLLALRAPFDGPDGEALRGRILAGARTGLPAALPPELGIVLACAMDVDRDRRYATAGAFGDDLQAVLDGAPIAARRLPASLRLRRYAQRHRALATAVAALLVFVIVLPSVLLWQQHQANVALSLQVARSDLAVEKQREANVALSEQVARSDRSVQVSIDAIEKLLAETASNRIRNLPAMQDLASRMLRDALDLFEQLAADERHGPRILLLRVQAMVRLASVESSLGRSTAAIAVARAALQLIPDGELLTNGLYSRAMARNLLAGLLLEAGRYEEGAGLVDGALADLQVLDRETPHRDEILQEIGMAHGVQALLAKVNKDTAAEERALRAAVAATAQARADSVPRGVARVNLSRFLKEQQRYEEGLRLCDEVLADNRDATGPERGWPVPRMVAALAGHERAIMLHRSGEAERAISAGTSALAAFDALVRDYPDDPSVVRMRGGTAHNLALVYWSRKDWAAARPLFEAACRDQLQALARNAGDQEAVGFLANHRRHLCNCLYELGDRAALETAARELGRMPGGPVLMYSAAFSLLRCIRDSEPERAAVLRSEALDLLEETRRRGRAVDADDPRLVQLRGEARFAAITGKPGG